jgi:hypothetical protein
LAASIEIGKVLVRVLEMSREQGPMSKSMSAAAWSMGMAMFLALGMVPK